MPYLDALLNIRDLDILGYIYVILVTFSILLFIWITINEGIFNALPLGITILLIEWAMSRFNYFYLKVRF